MRAPYRDLSRRRVLILVGIVLAASLVGVASAGGAAKPRQRHLAMDSGPLGTTPADQPALDAAAADAQSVAGSAYYTDARVNDIADSVDLYLADAPASLVDEVEALHPGVFVIHAAAHPLSELLELEHSLPAQVDGVDILSAYPTSDGFLDVGVQNESDVAVVQSALDSLDGAGLIRVFGGVQPLAFLGYRYSDTAPWNAGDFITHKGVDRFSGLTDGVDCSSGIEVHLSGNPNTTYMLTAAHCFWEFGSNTSPGVGTTVHNGYVQSDGSIYGSNTTIGNESKTDNDGNGQTSNDAALISASTGYDLFKSGWNSSLITAVASTVENYSGDFICDSGAYDGNICNIEVEQLNYRYSGCVGPSDCITVYGISAWNPSVSGAVAASGGDSGGPVYSLDANGNARARGMMDAGIPGTQTTCTSNPPPNWIPNEACYHELFFVGMGAITGDLNVATNVN